MRRTCSSFSMGCHAPRLSAAAELLLLRRWGASAISPSLEEAVAREELLEYALDERGQVDLVTVGLGVELAVLLELCRQPAGQT
jgi:hypothetical protein